MKILPVLEPLRRETTSPPTSTPTETKRRRGRPPLGDKRLTRAEIARRVREKQRVPLAWQRVGKALDKLLAALDHAGGDQISTAVVQIREQLDRLHA